LNEQNETGLNSKTSPKYRIARIEEPRLVNMNRDLRPPSGAGQSVKCGLMARGCRVLLPVFMLGFAGAGCGSIYRQTRATFPPESCAQLKLRVNEAQRAEKLAGQSILILRDRFNQGLSGEALATDVDRAEAAAFELERRVASAQDAEAHYEGQLQLANMIKRLDQRSKHLLDSLQAIRRAGYSTDTRQIDELLRSDGIP
jgi:hypothetical protein